MDSRPYHDTERPTTLNRTNSDRADPIVPRRKFRRRGTGEHADYTGANSDDNDEDKSVMSDSSEHELDAFNSDDDDLDVESGLPTEERRKFLSKKRKRNNIDSRVAGVGGSGVRLSKQEKQEADKHVARKLLVNAGLIGLWYFFSLSISLVSRRSAIRRVRPEFTHKDTTLKNSKLIQADSTTNGCSHPRISTSIFPSSRPLCTWWCSFS